MDDADHADACETHICKDHEVFCLADFVIDRIIRADKQEDVCRIFHFAVQRRILRDPGRHLQVAGGFHRLDDVSVFEKEFRNACRKCRFAGARRAGDQNASLAEDPFSEHVAGIVSVKIDGCDRTDDRDLGVIGKRFCRDGRPHVADLKDESTFPFDLNIRSRVGLRKIPQLFPDSIEFGTRADGRSDRFIFHAADGSAFGGRTEAAFQMNGHRRLIEKPMDSQIFVRQTPDDRLNEFRPDTVGF